MSPKAAPRYTFVDFVVGSSNEAAYTAASAAAVVPGRLHNPILVAGATGLGKTHLAHAVAHETLTRGERVARLVGADELLRRTADAVGTGTVASLLTELTACHVLVIDDVHVLDRHVAAQELLAAIAERAVSLEVQLLLTSDSAAGAAALATRLVRRFRSAHVAELGTPDWAHRVAIVQAKARAAGVTLPEAVARHVATDEAPSVRALEGRLTRVLAMAALEGGDGGAVTMGVARRALPDDAAARASGPSGARRVQSAVAVEWGVDPEALSGSGRTRAITEPRRMGMLLCRELLGLSLSEIGAAFGDRDRSTVLSALARARDELTSEPAIAARVARLRDALSDAGGGATAPSPR